MEHINRMTLDEVRTAMQTLHDGAEGRDLTTDEQNTWDALTARQTAAQASQDRLKALALGGNVERGTDAGTTSRTTAPTTRDNAMRVIERAVNAGQLPEHGAERVESLVSTGSAVSQAYAQRWALTTGTDAYRDAFCKLLADPDRGHLDWSREEQDAFRQARAFQAETRAMGESTGGAGGYLLPFVLDPTVLLTNSGTTNPLRAISRVVQTVSDSWHGITSAGITAEWTAEAAEMADASASLDQPGIPVHKLDAFTPYSYEVGMDGPGFLQELQRLLVDAADRLTATAYTVGTGIGQPTGIITSLVDDGSSVVNGGGSEALSSADPYTLQNALPPRWQANAQWAANLSVINTARQFETTNGALKFPELAGNPPRLLNRPVNEVSDMDGSLNASVTDNNYMLLYGDFQSFVIVDRIGTQLELIPNLMGANRRPTGQRGAVLWVRTGSDVVVPNAFRLLNVPTTA